MQWFILGFIFRSAPFGCIVGQPLRMKRENINRLKSVTRVPEAEIKLFPRGLSNQFWLPNLLQEARGERQLDENIL